MPRDFSHYRHHRPASRHGGFSLIELMVAMFLGVVVTTGLALLSDRSTNAFRDLERASTRIENGRYTMAMLTRELNHSGFFGHYYEMEEFPGAALPSPCTTDQSALESALSLSVQGYKGATSDPTGGCLGGENYLADTDVLVVRRAATAVTTPKDLSETVNRGRFYIQSNDIGTHYVLDTAKAVCADNKAIFNLLTPRPQYTATDVLPEQMDCFSYNASLDIRALVVDIFFISQCDQCADGGDAIPTLKRITLGAEGGAPVFTAAESLARGVENMRLFFGIDQYESGALDGEPEGQSLRGDLVGSGDIQEWSRLVTADLFLLIRSESRSPLWSDDSKTYVLGFDPNGDAVHPGGQFKRHLYRAQVRLNNPSNRQL